MFELFSFATFLPLSEGHIQNMPPNILAEFLLFLTQGLNVFAHLYLLFKFYRRRQYYK